MAVEDIELRHVMPPPLATNGFVPIAHSVSFAGTALHLFIEAELSEEMFATTAGPGQPIFPKTVMARSYRAELIEASPEGARSTAVEGLDVAYPMIEVLPSGELVVIGPRAKRYRDGTTDLNCLVFNPQGQILRRFLVGDGIQDAFSDNQGRIWVSYFDEGIFGDFGWGNAGGPMPIGASGLNCFDDFGNIVWDFGQAGGGDLISDCYAMNVDGANTWIYFYVDFPLYKITDDFQTRSWEVGLKGCSAFAVSDTKILFTGQRGDEPGTVYIAEWEKNSIGHFSKNRLVKPGGQAIEKGRLICRGPTVNYFDDFGWFHYTL